MSVPTFRQAHAFLGPLLRKNVMVMASGKEAGRRIGRFLLTCSSTLKKHVIIIDTSAFYGTNIIEFTRDLNPSFLHGTNLYVPIRAPLETLARLLNPEADIIIIDDMNALHHLLSRELEKEGTHRLLSMMRLVSFSARNSGFTVFSTVYNNEQGERTRIGTRSLAQMGDLLISVEDQPGKMTFKCDAENVWGSGSFTVTA